MGASTSPHGQSRDRRDFYETASATTAPERQDDAFVFYDKHYFYIGLRCDDPYPSKIRALVDRDHVCSARRQRGCVHRSAQRQAAAQEFRVNPRGVQGDAIFNDSSHVRISRRTSITTRLRVTNAGWEAEIRTRFRRCATAAPTPRRGPAHMAPIPRQFRYAIYSQPCREAALV